MAKKKQKPYSNKYKKKGNMGSIEKQEINYVPNGTVISAYIPLSDQTPTATHGGRSRETSRSNYHTKGHAQ